MSEASRVERLGTVMFVDAVCSALVALPAALRVSQAAGGTLVGAWCVCAALASVPLLASMMLLGGARTGLRAFAGGDVWARVVALAGWVVAMAFVLDRIGEMLRAKTHHHALAGVTYALCALGVGIALAVVSARVSALVENNRSRLLVATAVVVVGGLLVALRLREGVGLAEPSTRAFLVDLAAMAVGALLAAGAPPLPKVTARIGPLLFLLLLVLGWRASAGSAAAVAQQAPMYGWALGLLGFR